MKIEVFKVGLNYMAVQTKDSEPGVQNTITAQSVWLHKDRRSKGVSVGEGIFDVDSVELCLFGDEFLIELNNGEQIDE